MRFTEHELTAALTGAAKAVLSTDRKVRRSGGDVDAAWDAMDRFARFQVLDALGAQVLPVLVALPDVEVLPGTRATYTDVQVGEVVAGLIGEDKGRVRRAVEIKARTALVQQALAALPPRQDPDALIVPDHL